MKWWCNTDKFIRLEKQQVASTENFYSSSHNVRKFMHLVLWVLKHYKLENL